MYFILKGPINTLTTLTLSYVLSLQALPTEIQRISAVPARAALPALSLRLPGFHDYLQVVGVRRPGLQAGSQHPHPLHQHVRHAGE